jgi:SAM-dependent methyltransferase
MPCGKLNGGEIQGIALAGEGLEVPENHSAIVYIANTIHHATEKRQLFQPIHEALKPGARLFSFDPLAYNPVVKVHRRMATKTASTPPPTVTGNASTEKSARNPPLGLEHDDVGREEIRY